MQRRRIRLDSMRPLLSLGLIALLLAVSLLLKNPDTAIGLETGAGYSMRFYGHGVSAPDADRIKIRIDDPGTNLPGPPIDVGAQDFTLEFWIKGALAQNGAGAISCGANDSWINGNIVVDRDRYLQGRKYGISLGEGQLVFGVTGANNAMLTICGGTNVLDGAWHHVAVQRTAASGAMRLYVDGIQDAQGTGPTGDISYPDDGVPGNHCGGPCTNSDPFVVLAAEKHDAGSAFPSFNGFLDELRYSSGLRYPGNFARPTAPYVADANTVALFHFDEGPQGACTGTVIDSSGLPNAVNGVCNYGGAVQSGPQYVSDTPFQAGNGPTNTPINTPTNTRTPTPSRTPGPGTPTNTSTATRTATRMPSSTPSGTATATMTPGTPTATPVVRIFVPAVQNTP